MIELLSLPRRYSQNVPLPNFKFQTGLPINSLPGWEQIPLNLKLPMLKCPGNQVIFSKNKIGQSVKLRHLKHEFDPCGHDSIPEYNPLHDSNLRTFYSNERNLKRLRENGEITSNNDVICNLKDFNEYRRQLHKSQLYHILQEMNRVESEQRDRRLIANAESITNRDHQNLSARDHSLSKIIYRKFYLDQQQAERYKKLYERTLEKFTYIQMIKTINQSTLQHKKALQQLKYENHADVRNDLQRKKLIALKKLFQFKKERLQKNLRKLHDTRSKLEQERQTKSWNKRLAERIANRQKVQRLLDQVDKKKIIFVENHKLKYQKQWSRIQQQIKRRSRINQKKFTLNNKVKKLKTETNNKPYTIAMFQASFEKLLDSEVCEALDTVLALGDELKVPFEPDDPIYKAAQYIMQVILKNFNKDLSKDKITCDNVYERIDKFFDDSKKFVIFRASQIIASFQNRLSGTGNQNLRGASFVSFCQTSNTIGTSSYRIHPLIEIKDVSNRKPTPAGSLTSVIVDSTTSLVEKSNCSNLSRNDLVFIEHYIAKFKRELIVGVGRRVFAAIECHYENKTMEVRQELLDIDRKFLLNQVTKAILGYAVNPINFESIVKLCISALSSDIIWSLQNQLLKPKPDRRRTAKPSIQCSSNRKTNLLCLFCK